MSSRNAAYSSATGGGSSALYDSSHHVGTHISVRQPEHSQDTSSYSSYGPSPDRNPGHNTAGYAAPDLRGVTSSYGQYPVSNVGHSNLRLSLAPDSHNANAPSSGSIVHNVISYRAGQSPYN